MEEEILYRAQLFVNGKPLGNPHYYHEDRTYKLGIKRLREKIKSYPNYRYQGSYTVVKWKDLP